MSQLESSQNDVKYLSEEQVTALFARIKSVRDRALFRVIYHRGLRAAEPGLLQLADWDSDSGSLFVHRLKGSNSGRYHLIPVEANALRAWLRQRGTAPGPIFLTRKHTPIGRSHVWRLMQKYCAAAGIAIEKAHPHSLKHSCGTHVLTRVKDLVVVQDHLGHRSIQSTEIYAKFVGREKIADQLRDWK